jgi:uncharacterized phiE125 gp8 family phage protein
MESATVILQDAVVEPLTLYDVKTHLTLTQGAWDSYIGDIVLPSCRLETESSTERDLLVKKRKSVFNEWPDNEDNAFYLPIKPLQHVISVHYYDADNVDTTVDATVWGYDSNWEPGRVYLKYGQSWPSAQLWTSSPIVITYLTGYARQMAFTAAVTDVITCTGHTLQDGDTVYLMSTGTLPAGLTDGTMYYATTTVAGTSFKVSLTYGGGAVDITGTGTGTHYAIISQRTDVPKLLKSAILLRCGSRFEYREGVIVSSGSTSVAMLPEGVEAIESRYRMGWI